MSDHLGSRLSFTENRTVKKSFTLQKPSLVPLGVGKQIKQLQQQHKTGAVVVARDKLFSKSATLLLGMTLEVTYYISTLYP